MNSHENQIVLILISSIGFIASIQSVNVTVSHNATTIKHNNESAKPAKSVNFVHRNGHINNGNVTVPKSPFKTTNVTLRISNSSSSSAVHQLPIYPYSPSDDKNIQIMLSEGGGPKVAPQPPILPSMMSQYSNGFLPFPQTALPPPQPSGLPVMPTIRNTSALANMYLKSQQVNSMMSRMFVFPSALAALELVHITGTEMECYIAPPSTNVLDIQRVQNQFKISITCSLR